MSTYCHRWLDGTRIELPVGKGLCVGRNYADHAKEMGNQVPEEPMLFIKPPSAFTPLDEPVRLPAFSDDVHHEVELAVLIGKELSHSQSPEVAPAIAGCAVAIDLTARDLQAVLKKKGHPWEKSKGFDGACPISGFVDCASLGDLQSIDLGLLVNQEVRQRGSTRDMVYSVSDLIAYASRYFTLLPGDVVLTGTPAGVGPLRPGDKLDVELGSTHRFHTKVVAG